MDNEAGRAERCPKCLSGDPKWKAPLVDADSERIECRDRFHDAPPAASTGTPVKVDSDEHIAVIIGPVLREIYGDQVELGHYKIAIAVYKMATKACMDVLVPAPSEQGSAEQLAHEYCFWNEHLACRVTTEQQFKLAIERAQAGLRAQLQEREREAGLFKRRLATSEECRNNLANALAASEAPIQRLREALLKITTLTKLTPDAVRSIATAALAQLEAGKDTGGDK